MVLEQILIYLSITVLFLFLIISTIRDYLTLKKLEKTESFKLEIRRERDKVRLTR